jgi:hypothetical protein
MNYQHIQIYDWHFQELNNLYEAKEDSNNKTKQK